VHPEDREFFHLALVGVGARYKDYEIAHRIICGDGTIRKVSTRGRMYLDEQGRIERMVGTVFAVDNKLASPGVGELPGKSITEVASQFLI
jgi:hypothetical protein